MKTLASIRNFFGVLFIIALTVSCSSSDDDSGKRVKYVVHCDDAIITAIRYAKPDGTMQSITSATGPDWNKTIRVEVPFEAKIEVDFNNTTGHASGYYLAIFLDSDSDPWQLHSGPVPPSGLYTGTTSYLVTE